MKANKKWLAVLSAAALVTAVCPLSVSAESENLPKVRIVIENQTLSADSGADWTGTLVDEWVTMDENAAAKELFLAVLEEHHYTQQGAEFDYITEINGLSAEDGGAMGGWMILLDDWITDEYFSAYTAESGKIENGDTLCFAYSCGWGADLGYDWSGSDTTLSEVVFSAGALSPSFAAEIFDYTLTLPEGTETLTVQPVVGNKAYRAKVYANTYTPAEKGTDYKVGQSISVSDGDTIIIGVANEAWMQSNYNNAVESVYTFRINQPVQPIDTQVQAVESMIAAIGTVTKESGSAIEQAQRAFEALNEEQKQQVSNAAVLEEAIKAYAALSEDQTVLSVAELRETYPAAVTENPVYGNEWDIINLCRFGLATEEMKQHYIESVRQAVTEQDSAVLSSTRSTVNAGVVTALTACGADASNFYGFDLTAPLCDLDYVQKQGVNGAVYALIALDTHDYPTVDTAVRDQLIAAILAAQEQDGGWTIDTWTGVDDGSDADMTAMALQALAPYAADRAEVAKAVDKALTFLSAQQNDKGQFCSYGSYDSESCAQVLMALCALAADPDSDERFIKNGKTVYDGLMAFYRAEENGFAHLENGDANYLSTYQGYAAAAAYYRFTMKQTAYFDMTDTTLTVLKETEQPTESSESSENSQKESPSVPSAESSSVPAVSVPADSVKTGDSMPLYVLGGVMLLSAAVILGVRKRTKS